MFGDLISAGAGLVGGLLGSKSEKNVTKENIEFQKKFAKKGIRWRVSDAKAAGLHPLAALGAQTQSFTPNPVGGSALGDSISRAGQDIGRAIGAQLTPAERKLQDIQLMQEEAKLKNMGLQNMSLQGEIMRRNMTPAFPASDPSIQSSEVGAEYINKPLTREGAAGVEVGKNPLEQFFQMGDKSLLKVPSQAASEPMESSLGTAVEYHVYKMDKGSKNWKAWYNNKPTKEMIADYKYINKHNPPPKGKVWRIKKGRWFLVDAKTNKNSLFATQWINSRRNYGKKKKRKLRQRDYDVLMGGGSF